MEYFPNNYVLTLEIVNELRDIVLHAITGRLIRVDVVIQVDFIVTRHCDISYVNCTLGYGAKQDNTEYNQSHQSGRSTIRQTSKAKT